MRRGTGEKLSISIVVPVYNVSLYIERCIRSVMVQTYPVMECIIVDDATEDDSIEKCERLIKEYNDNVNLDHNLDHNLDGKGRIRFKILHHEVNRGLSAARNTGTDAAQGDYIYYLDSDDELTADCIEKLARPIERDPNIEMVQGSVCRHWMNGESVVSPKKIALPIASNQEEIRNCFYQYGQIYVNVWNKLLKRRVIIENNILCKEGLLYEDNLWIFYLLKYVKKAAFVADITYHQKKRQQSITTSTDEKTKWYHLNIVYREIMNNLTPGYEQEECYYYAKIIANIHAGYVRIVPEYKEILLLCQENCKLYGNRYLQLVLAVSSVLGKYRYGYTVWRCLMRARRTMMRH